jgi:hypothetical protein
MYTPKVKLFIFFPLAHIKNSLLGLDALILLHDKEHRKNIFHVSRLVFIFTQTTLSPFAYRFGCASMLNVSLYGVERPCIDNFQFHQ